MKIVIINGQNHKGSTYHIAQELAEKIGNDITEFFLPKDFGEFCIGCARCFTVSETKCPHYQKLLPLTEALNTADVIILASPVYVYHATGAMKAFLDHYGYRWMVHRPEERMFRKQGICISTAAGAGMKSTNKDMADSLFFWGVPRIEQLGIGVAAIDWDHVSDKKKRIIQKKSDAIARRIRRRHGKVKPGLKTKGFFHIMRMLQKKGWNEADVRYWQEKGWHQKNRPWKSPRISPDPSGEHS